MILIFTGSVIHAFAYNLESDNGLDVDHLLTSYCQEFGLKIIRQYTTVKLNHLLSVSTML